MEQPGEDDTRKNVEHVPLVTHDDYPELTLRSIVLAAILSVVLGAANIYLGLLVGLTISASIPASVMSMAILRALGGSNILENNIVQTGASAGESLAAGVIFTIPGLLILNKKNAAGEAGFENVQGWDTFMGINYLYITGLALFGGALGIFFSVPIRRAMLENMQPRLKFPEGVATSQVLVAGQEGGKAVLSVIVGGLIGALTKTAETLKFYVPEFGFAWLYAEKYPSAIQVNVGSALFAVGFIVGPNVGLVLLMGALSNYLVAMPISAYMNDESRTVPLAEGTDPTDLVWKEFKRTRYLGIGLMIIGGIWSVFSIRKALHKAITFGFATLRSSAQDMAEQVPRYQQDMPFKWNLIGVAFSLIPLWVIYSVFSGEFGLTVVLILFVAVTAFLFSAVAAYMAGLVGSSNNPVSGVTICSSLVISAMILALFGSDNNVGPPLAVVMCCSIASACSISGDNMQDLACGYIIGSTPRRQQIAQFVGVVSAAFVAAPVLELLETAYGISGTTGDGGKLQAPQAGIIATIPVGIINGGLPWNYIAVGVVYGAIIIAFDQFLAYRRASFRVPVLAFAVAIYLPMGYILPITLGSLIRPLCRIRSDEEASEGVLFSAGLIAGESLLGILFAALIVIGGSEWADAAFSIGTSPVWPVYIVGLFLLAVIAYFAKAQPFTRKGNSLQVSVDSL